ncbi:MAG: hypothetical protein HY078_16100 [Elusimicrobia bacterium]|nr:hypothetical protein [Elusimicrobiota bacterium]
MRETRLAGLGIVVALLAQSPARAAFFSATTEPKASPSPIDQRMKKDAQILHRAFGNDLPKVIGALGKILSQAQDPMIPYLATIERALQRLTAQGLITPEMVDRYHRDPYRDTSEITRALNQPRRLFKRPAPPALQRRSPVGRGAVKAPRGRSRARAPRARSLARPAMSRPGTPARPQAVAPRAGAFNARAFWEAADRTLP